MLRLRTPTVWTTVTFVIPYETLDPSRIRSADRKATLPPRHPALHRRVSGKGPTCPTGGQRVVFDALDPVAARQWDASRPPPFCWWTVRCKDADLLLADLERILLARGFPAAGLVARATAQHVPAFGRFQSAASLYPPRQP